MNNAFDRSLAQSVILAIAMFGSAGAVPALAGADLHLAQTHMDHSSAAQPAAGRTYKVGDLVVSAAWTRATPGGAKVAGGYVTVTNNGTAPDHLVAIKSDVSDRVEVHEMSMSSGVMKMRPLDEPLEIKPGETVALKPGGYHLMFLDLKQPLKQGDTLNAQLQFEKAGTVDVAFNVNAVGAMGDTPH